MGDKTISEATFRFTVKNIKSLKDTVLSPPCYIQELPWEIKVMPRQNITKDKRQRKSLGFFVECDGKNELSSWSCFARAELRLLSHKPDTEAFVRKIEHMFCSEESDWGYAHFIAWDEVMNPNKGYINNNEITLEVHINADMPEGVSPAPKKRITRVGDAANVANTATDKTSHDTLVKGPNSEAVQGEVIKTEETATSDMTVTQGSSSENNSQVQDMEHSTTEELLRPIQQDTNATEASAPTLVQLSTEHQSNVDDNPILNVLQRVEGILSSLLNTTQEQNAKRTHEDEYHYFALSVAAQLRKLPAHISVDTQTKIQSTLSTARLTAMFPNTPAPSSSHT